MQLHLVDATYELFRAFYAVPSLRAPDGSEVGAVQGLVGSMLKLLREPDVTHVACATDHVITSFRNELFAGYKTGDGVPRPLLEQFPLAEDALRALGLVVWPMIEFEADDALATAAHRYGPAFERVVICSPDKDLTQCVRGARVVTLDRRRETTYDEAGVRAKLGVAPAQVPDLLALAGDAQDGVPGIPGFGLKSSAAALAAFGTLEAIPDDPAAWSGVAVRGAARLAEALATRRAEARLYKRLTTLRTDVPLAETQDDLRWRGVPRAAFLALCERLGSERLPGRVPRWAE